MIHDPTINSTSMESILRIAIIYDFDGTLSPGNMQEYDFIPSVGKKPSEFWKESEELAEKEDGDTILAYLYNIIRSAKNNNISLRKESFMESGSRVIFFDGVEDWFKRINKYAKSKNIIIDHYINSSGIKEMIEGTKIAKEFKKIYACSFFYDVDGVAYWPSVVVNYTTKTQFLFKINKGIESVTDSKEVNKYIPESQRPIPFERMIYFGDGTTDIPCMRLVKSLGGYSIAVYNDNDGNYQQVKTLIDEGRVDYALKADYSKGKDIDDVVKKIIDKIGGDYELSMVKTR